MRRNFFFYLVSTSWRVGLRDIFIVSKKKIEKMDSHDVKVFAFDDFDNLTIPPRLVEASQTIKDLEKRGVAEYNVSRFCTYDSCKVITQCLSVEEKKIPPEELVTYIKIMDYLRVDIDFVFGFVPWHLISLDNCVKFSAFIYSLKVFNYTRLHNFVLCANLGLDIKPEFSQCYYRFKQYLKHEVRKDKAIFLAQKESWATFGVEITKASRKIIKLSDMPWNKDPNKPYTLY